MVTYTEVKEQESYCDKEIENTLIRMLIKDIIPETQLSLQVPNNINNNILNEVTI